MMIGITTGQQSRRNYMDAQRYTEADFNQIMGMLDEIRAAVATNTLHEIAAMDERVLVGSLKDILDTMQVTLDEIESNYRH